MLNDAAVVILAAGQGTRMKSRMAKVLHRAGGKPLVRQAKDRLNEITRLGRRSAGIMPPSVYLIAWVGKAAG